MTRKKTRLAEVANPEGRLDVVLYQVAARVMERLERDKGLVGLRDYLLPIVEDAIVEHIPGHNLLPREISAIAKLIELNQGRIT